ncbi:MAG: hypothetical protein K2R98_25015 [Gemmataceae bacterium]|nr:hypothetical protein [Gemmataceae bacterium]
MGMEQVVTYGEGVPPWTAVTKRLERYPCQMRMIDGQLAFPDEMPSEDWHELRIGTPQGMVTVRREADRVVLVTWGNADPGLRQGWNALTWAFADAGAGQVLAEQGPCTAAEYRQQVDLPEALK